MGFITLSNGETVHTSIFDTNPCVDIVEVSRIEIGNVIHIQQDFYYKNGEVHRNTLSYSNIVTNYTP